MNPARHRECLCERKSGTKRKKIGGDDRMKYPRRIFLEKRLKTG